MSESFGFGGRGPVSYTHLDVYKRQVADRVADGLAQRLVDGLHGRDVQLVVPVADGHVVADRVLDEQLGIRRIVERGGGSAAVRVVGVAGVTLLAEMCIRDRYLPFSSAASS